MFTPVFKLICSASSSHSGGGAARTSPTAGNTTRTSPLPGLSGLPRTVAMWAAACASALAVAACSPVGVGGVLPAPVDTELAQLDVREPHVGGYQRDAFGQRWSDDVDVEFGHNGCDTRNDILRRDLTNLEVKDGTHGCVAYSGTLVDPYSGAVVEFRRGQGGTAAEVHIDHVVALAQAWQTGAADWDDDTRRNFANDPRNLLATTKEMNKTKGAADASGWLPPREEFVCDYARRQVAVKLAYGLWVTPAEHDGLAAALATCPQE